MKKKIARPETESGLGKAQATAPDSESRTPGLGLRTLDF